jgi:hypothetical protein
VAVPLGVMYTLVGVVFAMPRHDIHAWRLAAWLVCGVGYAGQIGYEHFRLRNSPLSNAWHVAVAVAIGALGVAAVANVRSWSMAVSGQERHLLRLSLAIWPLITALPALVGALTIALGLSRAFPSPPTAEIEFGPTDGED